MFNLVLIFCSLCFLSECKSAKILGVFPTPSISHQVVFRPLMLELAKRGHEVTVITPNPIRLKGIASQNFTEIDVHDISYGVWKKIVMAKKDDNLSRVEISKLFLHLITETFKAQLDSPVIQQFLREHKKFDLLIYESLFRPALIFSHLYNVPAIEISSLSDLLSTLDVIGASTHPLIYPVPMHRRIYNLTLWEKVTEVYLHYAMQRVYFENVSIENKMLQKVFGVNIPCLNSLAKNVQLLFLNVHPLWDMNRLVPPNVVYLGGMHIQPVDELPQDLKSYLDSSKNGVIYMSFGTNAILSLLPPETIKIFTDVFSRLHYDIIWKWDEDELPGRSANIRLSKWLPQSALLGHPSVKLFITQGGQQSTDEALEAGVPLIGIPLHGDQWFNTEQYVRFDIGLQLSIHTVTEEKLKDAIEKAFDSSRFRKNIVALRNLMKDQPQTSLERAVWWTEYVLRHGNIPLRAPGSNVTWTEYYELKLIFLLLSFLIFALLIVIFVMCNTLRIVFKIKNNFSAKVKVS